MGGRDYEAEVIKVPPKRSSVTAGAAQTDAPVMMREYPKTPGQEPDQKTVAVPLREPKV